MGVGEKYYFIVNQNSQTGNASGIWEHLQEILDTREVDYEVYTTQYGGHATELAEMICKKEGEKQLVVVGGDGTINEVLCGIQDMEHVTFGVIPTGSANDFAKGMGLKGKPTEILERMLASRETMYIDHGTVEGGDGTSRRFAVSAGIGVDAYVCKQALDAPIKKLLNKFHLGQLTYVLLTIMDIFTMPLVDGKLTLADGSEKKLKRAIFVSAMSLPYEGGGIPMTPRASVTDGQLSCCCVTGIPRLVCFFYLVFLVFGKHENLPGVQIINSPKITVELQEPMCVHGDGEHCGFQEKVTFTCVPGKLKMKKI